MCVRCKRSFRRLDHADKAANDVRSTNAEVEGLRKERPRWRTRNGAHPKPVSAPTQCHTPNAASCPRHAHCQSALAALGPCPLTNPNCTNFPSLRLWSHASRRTWKQLQHKKYLTRPRHGARSCRRLRVCCAHQSAATADVTVVTVRVIAASPRVRWSSPSRFCCVRAARDVDHTATTPAQSCRATSNVKSEATGLHVLGHPSANSRRSRLKCRRGPRGWIIVLMSCNKHEAHIAAFCVVLTNFEKL
jgi:hypothetical protein